MTGKSENGDEPECVSFLECRGFKISDLILNDFERFRLKLDGDPIDFIRHFDIRHDFIQKYGFAILTKKIIDAIRPYSPILEVGSGSGYWSWELFTRGIDIVPTDNFSGEYGHFPKNGDEQILRRWENYYLLPRDMDAKDAIKEFRSRKTLMLIWPDYNEEWPADCLQVFTGNTVIYVGEGSGGCTANDRFHEILDSIYSDQTHISIPKFWGVHDSLVIARKPKQICNSRSSKSN